MTQPAAFPSATPRLALPLLFQGQAQKEFFLNQALAIVDAVSIRSVESASTAPPTEPTEGASYRVLAPAQEAWTGREDTLAIRIGGEWHFVEPEKGMSIFDKSADRLFFYYDEWRLAVEPSVPAGGDIIDAEARQTLAELVDALRKIGIFPEEGTI